MFVTAKLAWMRLRPSDSTPRTAILTTTSGRRSSASSSRRILRSRKATARPIAPTNTPTTPTRSPASTRMGSPPDLVAAKLAASDLPRGRGTNGWRAVASVFGCLGGIRPRAPEKTKPGGGYVTDADREEFHPPWRDDMSEISPSDPPHEPDIDPHEPDIEIVARVRADELRFDAEPEVEIRFPGSGRRDSRHVTTRRNIDRPIKPGKTYRRVFVATRISSRLLDDDAFG